jgi:hypothetical protein
MNMTMDEVQQQRRQVVITKREPVTLKSRSKAPAFTEIRTKTPRIVSW